MYVCVCVCVCVCVYFNIRDNADCINLLLVLVPTGFLVGLPDICVGRGICSSKADLRPERSRLWLGHLRLGELHY